MDASEHEPSHPSQSISDLFQFRCFPVGEALRRYQPACCMRPRRGAYVLYRETQGWRRLRATFDAPVLVYWKKIESHIGCLLPFLLLRHRIVVSFPSISANRLVRDENDKNKNKPEHPPHQVHTDKMIALVEMEHGVLPCAVAEEQY
jgi:hypothetical protein